MQLPSSGMLFTRATVNMPVETCKPQQIRRIGVSMYKYVSVDIHAYMPSTCNFGLHKPYVATFGLHKLYFATLIRHYPPRQHVKL
jgi:hypothetical protein